MHYIIVRDEGAMTVVPDSKEVRKFLTLSYRAMNKANGRTTFENLKADMFSPCVVGDGVAGLRSYQGFWRSLKEHLEKAKHTVTVRDERENLVGQPNLLQACMGLRAFQKLWIMTALMDGNSGLIGAVTRFGKSFGMSALCRAFPNARTVIIAPGVSLCKQLFDHMTETLPHRDVRGIYTGSKHKVQGPDITICSMDSMDKMDAADTDLLIIDECFTPDIELLTSDGFVRFDALSAGAVCAQYDLLDDSISFAKPDAFICKDYDGDLVTVRSDKLCDLTMTPGHEMVVREGGGWFKRSVEKIKFRSTISMPVAGMSKFVGPAELTPRERLILMLQADGSLHHRQSDGVTSWSFSFSKERKINAFLELMSCGEFEWNEVKGDPHRKLKPARRFMVKGLTDVSKSLYDHFDISELSFDKARSIVEAAMLWDGHLHSETSWYYSCTVKENVDFMQSVCVLAGYKSNMTVQVDDRSENFSDVYRLFIDISKMTAGTQSLRKTTSPYRGKVYCVRVPTGNIIVRRRGKPVVVGNCHAVVSDERLPKLAAFEKARKYGFGATLTGRFDKKDRLIEGLIGPVLVNVSYKEGVALGAVSPLKVMMIKIPFSKDTIPGNRVERDVVYKRLLHQSSKAAKLVKQLVDEIIPADWQTMAFISNEKQAEFYMEHAFPTHGTIAMAKRMKDKERDAITDRIASGELVRVLASNIYVQGITFPDLKVVINLAGGGANTTAIQKPGRLLQCRPGKNYGVMIDFIFECRDAEADTRSHPPYQGIVGESWARHKAYEEIGYDVVFVERAEQAHDIMRGAYNE